MSEEGLPSILLLERRIQLQDLERLVMAHFGDMVKYVVDIERSTLAIGGELHADSEEVLLEHGSRQTDIWGANYYPGLGPECCIELTSLINIRPSVGNRSMEIQDSGIQERVRRITYDLIGKGEEPGWPRSTEG